tara:strand:- start:1175 stop:1771 length:597 start_codon:yes stop_codon:yes gene_type:complete
MAAVAAIAGVGLMVVCSSSLAAVMMMGGEEETPDTGGGAGPSAPDETFTVPTEADSLSECYGARYTDLRAAFGTDKAALGRHYTTYTTNGSENRSNSCILSDEEAQCYLDRYPAVQAYAGTNLKLARKHYYEVGMGENKDFTCPPGVKELKCYGERYPDLQNAFGSDYVARSTASTLYKLNQHWSAYGQGEGRDFSCP